MWFTGYFLIFLLIGSILLMNLFVGVILVNYKLADSNPNFALYYPPKN
jgi:hypothetical protein